jgi:hypothetical protein
LRIGVVDSVVVSVVEIVLDVIVVIVGDGNFG